MTFRHFKLILEKHVQGTFGENANAQNKAQFCIQYDFF